MADNYPAIPKNPVTLAINGWLIDNYLKNFFKKYLPNYEMIITSEYRTAAQNEAAGGAQWSSHLYNLGRDFALKFSSGIILNDAQAREVYNDYIAPYWEGFSKFYPTGQGENSHHVHANIDRDISLYTKWVGVAGLAAGAAWAFKKYHKKFNPKGSENAD